MSMIVTLGQVLDLVGKLDDTPGNETARERFRRFLSENVAEAGHLRDYVEEALRTSGDQYNRAFQDLVNHIGRFLGFEIVFGRYQGTQTQVGFDGHWKAPSGFHIVVEVKTSDTYNVKTNVLVGYVDRLITDRHIPNWERVMGLYVIGRADPEIRQIEKDIIVEGRTSSLRVVSVDALLSLAELASASNVSHDEVLGILRPSGPSIDPIANLMARLVTESKSASIADAELPRLPSEEPQRSEPQYWLAPVGGDEENTAQDVVNQLVGSKHVWAFGDKTSGRRLVKAGDWICFHASGVGVVGHARVATDPERKRDNRLRDPDTYCWPFDLVDTKVYTDQPVVIDAAVRRQLDAFAGKNPDAQWGWFVVSTSRLTADDYHRLTR